MDTAASSDLAVFFKYVAPALIGVMGLLAGFAFKRKASEQAGEDTVYKMMSDTIARLNAEVAERDARILSLMNNILMLNEQRNEADAIASKAQHMAELAEESAKKATEAAQQALTEIEELRRMRSRDKKYIDMLESLLSDANITIPEKHFEA